MIGGYSFALASLTTASTPEQLPRIIAGKQRAKQFVFNAQHGQAQRAERRRGGAEAIEQIARDERAVNRGQREAVRLLVHATQTDLDSTRESSHAHVRKNIRNEYI